MKKSYEHRNRSLAMRHKLGTKKTNGRHFIININSALKIGNQKPLE